MFKDKSDAIITKLRRIQVDLIKEAYETNGIYLGATKNKIEYHNYLDEDPIIITVDGAGNQTIESTGTIDNSSTNNSSTSVVNKNANYHVSAGDFGKKGSPRALIIEALGFSSRVPSQSECSAKMQRVHLAQYGYKYESSAPVRVHKDLVKEVENIFKEIFALGVEVSQIWSYCYRKINNSSAKEPKPLSMHSFGCAIDFNAPVNPFSKSSKVVNQPDDLKQGILRTKDHPIVKIFAKYGWGWGGRYYDYMHFSKADGG